MTPAETEYLAAERALRTLIPRFAGDVPKAQLRLVNALKALCREAVGPVVRPTIST
jgi:hypothetical protein